jgi:hypothetical protein
LLKYFIFKFKLITPYTLPLRSYRHLGKTVFHYIFLRKILEEKNKKSSGLNFRFLPKLKLHNAVHYSTNYNYLRNSYFLHIMHLLCF